MTYAVTELLEGETLRERLVGGALEQLVRRCLEKEPAARFQSTSDLDFALKNLLETSGSGLHKAMSEEGGKARLHRFGLPALAAVLAIGLAAGAGLVVWLSPKPAPSPPLIRPLTFSGKDYAPTILPTAASSLSSRSGTAGSASG